MLCWRAAIIRTQELYSPHSKLPITSSRVRMRWLLSKVIVCADRLCCDLAAGASIKAALAQRDDSANVQISGMTLTRNEPRPRAAQRKATCTRETVCVCVVCIIIRRRQCRSTIQRVRSVSARQRPGRHRFHRSRPFHDDPQRGNVTCVLGAAPRVQIR